MTAYRHSMTAFLIVAMSTLSCSFAPSTQRAATREVAPVAPSSGDAIEVARALGQLHTGLLPDEVARLGAAIVTESRRADIPAKLVLALIQVESSGNAFAVSHVGAIGLMQLRPSTAEEVAESLSIRWTGAAMLFEPVMNVRLGVEYLRVLIDRYGSVSTALAAYNWGPGRIGQKLRRGEAVPAAYADKVMSKYRKPLSSSI